MPPPGQKPATEEEVLKPYFELANGAIYGIALDSSRGHHLARVKILHVFKGTEKIGAIINGYPSLGFAWPPCALMGLPDPAIGKGQKGVILLFGTDKPDFVFVDQYHLDIMIKAGWIKSINLPKD
jgi:hypothetical protein